MVGQSRVRVGTTCPSGHFAWGWPAFARLATYRPAGCHQPQHGLVGRRGHRIMDGL